MQRVKCQREVAPNQSQIGTLKAETAQRKMKRCITCKCSKFTAYFLCFDGVFMVMHFSTKIYITVCVFYINMNKTLKMAVPEFEPGSSGPQPLMLTTTLYHHGNNYYLSILHFVYAAATTTTGNQNAESTNQHPKSGIHKAESKKQNWQRRIYTKTCAEKNLQRPSKEKYLFLSNGYDHCLISEEFGFM